MDKTLGFVKDHLFHFCDLAAFQLFDVLKFNNTISVVSTETRRLHLSYSKLLRDQVLYVEGFKHVTGSVEI